MMLSTIVIRSGGIGGNIRNCYRHTENSERKAVMEVDPGLRRDFLEQANRGLKLARGYEFLERL